MNSITEAVPNARIGQVVTEARQCGFTWLIRSNRAFKTAQTKKEKEIVKLKDITSGDIHTVRANKKVRWIMRNDRFYTMAISKEESAKYRVNHTMVGEIDFSAGRIFLWDDATQIFWETELA